jgi:hypothetical protein
LRRSRTRRAGAVSFWDAKLEAFAPGLALEAGGAIIEDPRACPGYTLSRKVVPVQFPLKLVGCRMLAPTVGHYQFVRDDGQPLDFQPGQFIQVHFSYADGTETKRSYSLATIHDHALGPGEAVDIAVSFVPGGAATALFEALEQGGQISASGLWPVLPESR